MMLEMEFMVVEKGAWEGYWFLEPGPHQSPKSGAGKGGDNIRDSISSPPPRLPVGAT